MRHYDGRYDELYTENIVYMQKFVAFMQFYGVI